MQVLFIIIIFNPGRQARETTNQGDQQLKICRATKLN